MPWEWIGYAAGVMTIAIYIPQARQVFKHRHDEHALRGMSVLAVGASVVEFALWIAWGVGRGVPEGAIPYAVLLPFVLTTFVVVLRAHVRRRRERRADAILPDPEPAAELATTD